MINFTFCSHRSKFEFFAILSLSLSLCLSLFIQTKVYFTPEIVAFQFLPVHYLSLFFDIHQLFTSTRVTFRTNQKQVFHKQSQQFYPSLPLLSAAISHMNRPTVWIRPVALQKFLSKVKCDEKSHDICQRCRKENAFAHKSLGAVRKHFVIFKWSVKINRDFDIVPQPSFLCKFCLGTQSHQICFHNFVRLHSCK